MRIDERAFVYEKRFHPVPRVLQSFFAKTGVGVTVVPEFAYGIRAKDNGA